MCFALPTDTYRLGFIVTTVCLLTACAPSTKNQFGDPAHDIEKGDIHLLSFGLELANTKTDHITDSLQKHYGFYYKNIGCGVDQQSLIDSHAYNDAVIEHIALSHGNKWFENYNRQVDSIYAVSAKETLK